MTEDTGMEKGEWKEELIAFGSDGCAVMTGKGEMVFGDFFNKTHQKRTSRVSGVVPTR